MACLKASILFLIAALFVSQTMAEELPVFNGFLTYTEARGGVCNITGSVNSISMNAAQFEDSCGRCVQVKGLGGGVGSSPPQQSLIIARVVNICPQCQYGDLDMQAQGEGRFEIEWSFVPCPEAPSRKLLQSLV